MDLILRIFAVISLGVLCLTAGCSTTPIPTNALLPGEDPAGAMKEVMERKGTLVLLSPEWTRNKPALIMLHGATDDPSEMMDIAREYRNQYAVYLYSFNYHKPLKKVAADFMREAERLRAEKRLGEQPTVIDYSYSATVFRQAIIGAKDPSALAGASLIQITPTAGGSNRARLLRDPFFRLLAGWASKPSAAVNPYGGLAEKLWGAKGTEKFCSVIPPERTFTILVYHDSHSLADSGNKTVREHYLNGIGKNIVVIPAYVPVDHEYFPTEPAGLNYLREAMRHTEQNTRLSAHRLSNSNFKIQ